MAVGMVCWRLRPNHRALHPPLGDPRQFSDSRSNIFQRDQAERDQPLGIITAILSRPIVICPEAGGTQFDIVKTIERHAHRGIDNFRPHAIEVLVLYPCGRIPNALRRSIKSLLVVLRQIFRFDAGAEERRDRDRINLLTDEELAILAIHAAPRGLMVSVAGQPMGGCDSITLTGELQAGDHFEKVIGGELVFRLEPDRLGPDGKLHGWGISLAPLHEPDRDYIYPVNPPLRFNGLQILGPSYADDPKTSLAHPHEIRFLLHRAAYD